MCLRFVILALNILVFATLLFTYSAYQFYSFSYLFSKTHVDNYINQSRILNSTKVYVKYLDIECFTVNDTFRFAGINSDNHTYIFSKAFQLFDSLNQINQYSFYSIYSDDCGYYYSSVVNPLYSTYESYLYLVFWVLVASCIFIFLIQLLYIVFILKFNYV